MASSFHPRRGQDPAGLVTISVVRQTTYNDFQLHSLQLLKSLQPSEWTWKDGLKKTFLLRVASLLGKKGS
eukprot:1160902-Pelagomonas_calceolata.AAC.8